MLLHSQADAGNTYSLTLCGQDPTSCPEDQSGVFNGMAVQTQGGGCYVLAVFGPQKQCSWDNTKVANGLSLSMSDGTPTYCGSPRTLQIDFTCPADGSTLIPSSWEAVNTPGTCDYVYKLETCAVCKGGCSAGGGFGSIFCILFFFVALPLYLFGGAAYQYQIMGLRGAEMFTSLWPSTFVEYVKDGIAFTARGCKGGGNDGGKLVGSAQADGSSGVTSSSDGYQPYQNI